MIFFYYLVIFQLFSYACSARYVSLIPKILSDISFCLKYRVDREGGREGRECCFSISPEEVKFLVTTLALSVCAAARLRAGVCSASARVHVPTLARCTRRPACTDALHTATL